MKEWLFKKSFRIRLNYYKKGYGKILINNILDKCLEYKIDRLYIYSLDNVIDFYKKLGF